MRPPVGIQHCTHILSDHCGWCSWRSVDTRTCHCPLSGSSHWWTRAYPLILGTRTALNTHAHVTWLPWTQVGSYSKHDCVTHTLGTRWIFVSGLPFSTDALRKVVADQLEAEVTGVFSAVSVICLVVAHQAIFNIRRPCTTAWCCITIYTHYYTYKSDTFLYRWPWPVTYRWHRQVCDSKYHCNRQEPTDWTTCSHHCSYPSPWTGCGCIRIPEVCVGREAGHSGNVLSLVLCTVLHHHNNNSTNMVEMLQQIH